MTSIETIYITGVVITFVLFIVYQGFSDPHDKTPVMYFYTPLVFMSAAAAFFWPLIVAIGTIVLPPVGLYKLGQWLGHRLKK